MLSRRLIVIALALALAPVPAFAQDAKSPFRFVPGDAEFVLQVDRPRDLVDTALKHDLYQKALLLPGYREIYDSTNTQRLFQLVAYFEKQLGQDKEAILDELTAGGVVVAGKFTQEKGAVLVMQAKSDKALRRFLDVAIDLFDKELERQESKDRVVRGKHQKFDTFKAGKDLYAAANDGVFILSNDEATLKKVLDQAKNKSILQVPGFVESRKLAPAKPLAWAWINLEKLREHKPFAAPLDAATLDPFQILLFGGLTNTIKRAPYVAALLLRDGNDYRVSISAPSGKDGMGALAHMLLPADDRGTLAPLQPPRTLATSSYFIDLGQFWDKRKEIFGEKNAKGLEEGEQGISKVAGGIKISKLLKSVSPHQRLVFAQQKESPYKIKPATPFPAFALVIGMRDPAFADDMDRIFRTAALASTGFVGLALKDESYKDCDIYSYYFSETKKVEFDPTNIRFNFAPSWVTVGDQFVMSATPELARDVIDILKAEKPSSSKATMRTQLYAKGFNDLVRANEDGAITGLILAQAVAPKNAKAELRALMDWIEQLGQLQFEINYGTSDFRYDILWRTKTK